MKKIIPISLLMIAILMASYAAISYERTKKREIYGTQARIAIFTPTSHPALEEIEQGFKQTLHTVTDQQGEGVLEYSFTTFNANGNKTLLSAQAQEIVSGNYDLIFTIGAGASQTVAELLKKRGKETPHVFCAVDGAEFARSLTTTNPSSTGVYVSVDYQKEMAALHRCKPGIKNMLLVYDPTHGTGLEKYKHEIVDYNKKYGTVVHSVEIYQTNEIQQKVAALLPTMDAVLVLTDNTVVAGIDALITLCNRYGVTLCASDLASGKKGAAFAYGITEYESGASGAHQAAAILVDKKKPHELGIDAVANFRVEINRETMQAQRLNVNAACVASVASSEGALS